MSLLSGLFSNPGQSAAGNQSKRNGKVGSTYADLFSNQAGQYEQFQQILQNSGLMGGIDSAFNTLNQDPEQRVQQFKSGADERANQQAAQNATFLRSQGYGDGAIQGAGAGAFSQAAQNTNEYAQQQMDPQEQLRRFMAFLQAIGGAQGLFGNSLNQLGSGVYGQPQVQVQQNPFAAILGQAAGGYSSTLGKGR